MSVSSALWPADKLGEALEALVRASGHAIHQEIAAPPPSMPTDALEGWLDTALLPLGLEAEAVHAPYSEIVDLVRECGPALARIETDGEVKFALLLSGRRRAVTLLGPDLRRYRVTASELAERLCARQASAVTSDVDALLDMADVPARRRDVVRRALIEQHLSLPVGGVWMISALPGAPMLAQLRSARLGRDAIGMLLAHGATYVLLIAAWWLVGKGALEGRLEPGWLAGWMLLLLSIVPCELLVTWLQGRFAIGTGAVLKRRLLYGVMRLEPDEIRHQGVGGLLGKVIEAEAVESLALSGGAAVLLASVELAAAAFVLTVGGGVLLLSLLCAWVLFGMTLAWRYYRRMRDWSRHRVTLTNDLVERMVGHRTRLAQMPRPRWHEGEDQLVERYFELSREMDRMAQRTAALLPRGWMLLGVIGMAPAFVAGAATPVGIAVSVGGIWLGHLALTKIVVGLAQLGSAAIAWEQIAPIYRAAERPEEPGMPAATLSIAKTSVGDGPLMEARDVHFGYPERPPVLRGCALSILDRDRLLLEGASGGGKSTLAALLAGLRQPDRGIVLLRGLDRPTLGAHAWRRRIATAPQFHDNHVLTGTFAFNLLMGRSWPPRRRDLEQAEELCHALGLGALLERMPGGLMQTVGDTGWQLSHGERGRLFLARALLQDAELIILDESFAALDPESQRQTLGCALERAPALLLIAHP